MSGMRVRITMALLGACMVVVLGWFAWLGMRIPAGVEFFVRTDGIEMVRIPTDRDFGVLHDRQRLIWLQGSSGLPDPKPLADSEAIDTKRPIFPPRYIKDYD